MEKKKKKNQYIKVDRAEIKRETHRVVKERKSGPHTTLQSLLLLEEANSAFKFPTKKGVCSL